MRQFQYQTFKLTFFLINCDCNVFHLILVKILWIVIYSFFLYFCYAFIFPFFFSFSINKLNKNSYQISEYQDCYHTDIFSLIFADLLWYHIWSLSALILTMLSISSCSVSWMTSIWHLPSCLVQLSTTSVFIIILIYIYSFNSHERCN